MKKFYVGIKGIIFDKQRGVLLLSRDYKSGDSWDTPGGRMDGNETFAETLARELDEELPGIKVANIGKLLGAHRVQKDIDGEISLVLLYFKVEASLPDPIKLSDEHDGHLWVATKADIPVGLNEQVTKILQEILPN